MDSIYLPIAEFPVLPLWISFGAGLLGILSGLPGVGLNVYLTPLLLWIGVPTIVASGIGTNQWIICTLTRNIFKIKRTSCDIGLSSIIMIGGFFGIYAGVRFIERFWADLSVFVEIFYIFISLFLFCCMLTRIYYMLARINRTHYESSVQRIRRLMRNNWVRRLPLRCRFWRSHMRVSVIAPLIVGVVAGFLSVSVGLGASIIITPAAAYILRLPTSIIFGTVELCVFFIALASTLVHVLYFASVDVILMLLILVGGIFGTACGLLFKSKAPASTQVVSFGGALVILLVSILTACELFSKPNEPYIVEAPERPSAVRGLPIESR
jgi:uncharacterized protein